MIISVFISDYTGDRASQVKLSALFRRTKRPRQAVAEEKAFAFIIEVSSDQPETIALTSSSSPTVTGQGPAALPSQYNSFGTVDVNYNYIVPVSSVNISCTLAASRVILPVTRPGLLDTAWAV